MEQETFSSVISSKEDPSLSHIYPRHTHTYTHMPPLTHAGTLIHSKTHSHTHTHTFSREAQC